MTQITDIYKFTEYWKNRYPTVYQGKSDRDILELVKQRYPEHQFPSYEEALQTDESVYVQEQPKDYPEESLLSRKTDPKWVDSFFLTSDFIPEKWQTEGALGGLMSADFFKKSYNESMAGMLYRTAHGEDKWDVGEEYDPAWYAQAGQFAVGMMSPLDVVTMLATGGLGKVAGVAGKVGLFGGNIGRKYVEKGLLTNYALRNKTVGNVLSRTVDGALNLGVGGGSFAASHAMVQETARQRAENPDKPVDISKALTVASDEFLHAAPMFAIAGGVTQGIMGSIYGYSQAFASKSPTYSQKLTQAATSPLARVGTEAALFTSLPSVLGDQEAPKLGSNEWWAALGTNTLIVGGMRAVGKFVEPKIVTSEGKKVSMEAFDVINGEINLAKKADAAQLKSTQEVVSTLKDTGASIPKNVTDLVRDLEIRIGESSKTKAEIKKNYKFIQEINNKIDTVPKYLEKAAIKGSKENLDLIKYQKLINDHSTFANGVVESILTQEGRAAEIYKDAMGRTPNKTELISFEKALENTKDGVIKNQKAVDDYLTGNWLQSKDGINGGESALKTPKVKPVKTKIDEINKYVDLLAGEKGVLPTEIIKEKKYQKDILIQGESELSLRKLKDAYKGEIEKRPGTPSTELTKVLTSLDITKTKGLPVFSRKIAGKTTVKDYIDGLKLDKTNEKMLYQGISEFMQGRKSSKAPTNMKLVADYAKWLESKGKNLSQADRSLTDLYINEQNTLGKLTTKNQRRQLNNSLAAF